MLTYLNIFLIAFSLAVFFTWLMRKAAFKFDILDRPEKAPDRKIHIKPMPLLGGVAIFLAFNLTVLFNLSELLGGYMLEKYLWGIFLGGLILIVGGVLDDKFDLPPGTQFLFPVLASLVVIASGIGIDYITNPFGGIVYLDQFNLTLFEYQGLPYGVVLWADLFTLAWLLGMMYTTKFLDGLDGLVSGITVIGGIIIFFLSLSQDVYQPETAILALILSGSALGCLLFNFNPARIYLGEGGSLFTGFMLGVLAIISGGKIATALLIMGLPILDTAWVIFRRIFIERKSPFKGDRKHLHFRLLDLGLTQRQVILILWLIVAMFGTGSLFLESGGKLWALAVLGVIGLGLASFVVYKLTKNRK